MKQEHPCAFATCPARFRPLLLGFAVFAGCTVQTAAATQLLAVTGDRVNLRAAPIPTAEVVGQVSRTDTLVLQGDVKEPWVRVTPPDSIDLWIYANLVKDEKVLVNSAQVRAGPGLNFHVVGQLQSGAPIVKRGEIGDWLKIAPFPAAAVWITNAYVRPVATPTPAPQPVVADPPTPPTTPPPQPDQKASDVKPASPAGAAPITRAPATPAPAPAAPPTRRTLLRSQADGPVGPAKVPASRLRRDVGQAAVGNYSGTLARVPHGNHPTHYRLVSFSADNTPQTICYVLGNRRQLDTLKNGFFSIEGAVYWFKSTELPTIFAQNILRHKSP